ncbi:MAG: hypothetical protein ACT4PO_03425 [Actinomycetota bacterium]
MRDHLRTELVLEALEMAIANRRPARGPPAPLRQSVCGGRDRSLDGLRGGRIRQELVFKLHLLLRIRRGLGLRGGSPRVRRAWGPRASGARRAVRSCRWPGGR